MPPETVSPTSSTQGPSFHHTWAPEAPLQNSLEPHQLLCRIPRHAVHLQLYQSCFSPAAPKEKNRTARLTSLPHLQLSSHRSVLSSFQSIPQKRKHLFLLGSYIPGELWDSSTGLFHHPLPTGVGTSLSWQWLQKHHEPPHPTRRAESFYNR